jgi:hypothetical protein
MQKKGVTLNVVIVLAVFLVVLSIIGILAVNDRINTKINDLASQSAKSNGQAQVSLTIVPAPVMNAQVSVNVQPTPKNK